MTRLEWVVFVLAIGWAIATNLNVRQYYKTSSTPVLPANTFAFVQAASLFGILIFHYSPLHLLWLFPLSYVAGFVALRSKVVAFLPWLYGYVLSYTIPKNW